jgi:hypothetical protein
MGQKKTANAKTLPCGHAAPEGTVTIKPGDAPGVDRAVSALFAFGAKVEGMRAEVLEGGEVPPLMATLALMQEKDEAWKRIRSEVKAAGLIKSDVDYNANIDKESRVLLFTPQQDGDDEILHQITRMMAEGNGQQPTFH